MDQSLLARLDPELLEALADMVAKRLRNPSIGLLTIGTLTRAADGTTKASDVQLETDQDREQLDRILRGEAPPPAGTKLIKAAVDLESQIAVFLGERKRTPETFRQNESTLRRYLACAEKAGFPADSRQALAAFKNEMKANGLKPRTINLNLSRIGAFIGWANAHGLADSNPVSRAVKMAPDADTVEVIEPYSRAEVQAFIDRLCLDPSDGHFEARHWYIALLVASGARANEVASLRCVDVQTEGNIVYIDIGKEGNRQVKNKSSVRRVPVIDALAEPLLDHAAGLVADGHDLLFPFWAARRPGGSAGHWARGWLDGGIHRIRHSVATELRDAGVIETVAAEVLGHTLGSSLSFGLYAGRSPLATLKDALEKSVGTAYRWPNVPGNAEEPR